MKIEEQNSNEPQKPQLNIPAVSGSCFGRVSESVFSDLKSLDDLITKMGITPRQLLRVNVPPYAEHKLDNLSLTDDDLIQAMLADPLLINRPIVVSDKGVKLCRPSEVVLDLIDTPLTKTFIKEDGEKIEPTI